MPSMNLITWQTYGKMIDELAKSIQESKDFKKIRSIAGIPRGGLIVATVLSHKLKLPLVYVEEATPSCLVVDDLTDTGNTLSGLPEVKGRKSAALFVKPWSDPKPDFWVKETDAYIIFPYETLQVEEQSTSYERYQLVSGGE